MVSNFGQENSQIHNGLYYLLNGLRNSQVHRHNNKRPP